MYLMVIFFLTFSGELSNVAYEHENVMDCDRNLAAVLQAFAAQGITVYGSRCLHQQVT